MYGIQRQVLLLLKKKVSSHAVRFDFLASILQGVSDLYLARFHPARRARPSLRLYQKTVTHSLCHQLGLYVTLFLDISCLATYAALLRLFF